MNDANIPNQPTLLATLEAKSKAIGFTMPSDLYIGSLLRTLVSAKPRANILELGTGIGLSLCWMIDGMDAASRLISIDNDPQLSAIAQQYFGEEENVQIVCTDGANWIKQYQGERFDLIFADAWPGKYSEIEEILELVKIGGFYIVDDMTTRPTWPTGHQDKADQLVAYLDSRKDFNLTKMNWSSGLIVATKKG